jgi:hypothetical protein
MAAAICLVGINEVFTGGDSSPAVLQNWSVLVSAEGDASRCGQDRHQC